MPAYSDTLGERQKCHCKGGVTVTTYTLLQDKPHVDTKFNTRVPKSNYYSLEFHIISIAEVL